MRSVTGTRAGDPITDGKAGNTVSNRRNDTGCTVAKLCGAVELRFYGVIGADNALGLYAIDDLFDQVGALFSTPGEAFLARINGRFLRSGTYQRCGGPHQ